MPPIDVFGSERHFVDHLRPIHDALSEPGAFLARTDSLVGDNPILVASYGDLKRVRAVRRHIALIEHGYGQTFSNSHPSYAGGIDRQEVSLFLVPNDHAAHRNRESNPDAMVEIVGCPKLDTLPKREGTGQTLAIGFHWDAAGVAPEATGTASYYRKHLTQLAERYHVLGHGHPRVMGRLTRYYQRAKIEPVTEFADICRRADLYICDYSSTIYEFAATGRPVVVLNGPQYRRDVHHGLRFWEAATVGVQVDHPNQLYDAIEYALTDPPEQQRLREQALNLVYKYRSGGAQRAVKALERWAATTQRIAA